VCQNLWLKLQEQDRLRRLKLSAGTWLIRRKSRNSLACAISAIASRASGAGPFGNTTTICRKCYVHPGVITAYLEGTLINELSQYQATEQSMQTFASATEQNHGLHPDEERVLLFLKQHCDTANKL
jgi:DNA topoisomerase IB